MSDLPRIAIETPDELKVKTDGKRVLRQGIPHTSLDVVATTGCKATTEVTKE